MCPLQSTLTFSSASSGPPLSVSSCPLLASLFPHSSGRWHHGRLLVGSYLVGGGQVFTPLPSHMGGDTGRICSHQWSSVCSPLHRLLFHFSCIVTGSAHRFELPLFPASLHACLRASSCALIFPCCGLVHSPLFSALDYCRLPSDRGCRGFLLSFAPRLHSRGFRSLLRLHDVFTGFHLAFHRQVTVVPDGWFSPVPSIHLPSLALPEDPQSVVSSMALLFFVVAAPTSCACRHLMSEFFLSCIILIHHSRRCPNRLAWLMVRSLNRTPWIIGFPFTRPVRPHGSGLLVHLFPRRQLRRAYAPAFIAAQHSWDL